MRNNEMIDIEGFFQDSYQEAQEMVTQPGEVDNLMKKLVKKLQDVPKLGSALAYIPKMALMVNSFIRGDYKEIPVGIITAIIGVLIYFVSPIDAIPDFIPGVGLLDDAAVTSGSLYLVKNDLDEYMHWRKVTGMDEDEFDQDQI